MEWNTDIVEDFLKAISIKGFSCLIKLLWDMEDTLGGKKNNSILFLLFLQKGKIIRIIDSKVSGFSVVAVQDNNESQEV